MTRPSPSNNGFTLLELLLVLALASLLFALVPPLLQKAVPGVQLKSSARELAAALGRARSTSVSEQKETWVTVDVDKHGFWLSGRDARRRSIPDGLEIKLLTAESELQDEGIGRIRFFPEGGSTGGRVTLLRDGKGYLIDIDWLTGRIRVEPTST